MIYHVGQQAEPYEQSPLPSSAHLETMTLRPLPSSVLLKRVSSTLNASSNLSEALQTVVEELVVTLTFTSCAVLVIDRSGQCGIVQAHYHRSAELRTCYGTQVPLGLYPALVEVVRTATAKVVSSPPTSPWAQRQQGLDQAAEAHVSLSLPLISAGRVVGVLLCQRVSPEGSMTEEETLVLETSAELITNALERTKGLLKGDTFSMLAHDLRSPVLIVVGLLDLLLQGIYGPLTSEQQQILSDLKDHSDLFLGLINDVLDLCPYETSRLI